MLLPLSGACAAEMVNIDVADGQETITLAIKNTDPHKVFTVENPDRLVVDVPTMNGHRKTALPSSYDGKLIKGVRFGQFDPNTSRFVFDLQQPVRVVDAHGGDGTLVIEIAANEIPPPAGGRLGGGHNETPRLQHPHPNPPSTGKGIKQKHAAKKPEKPLVIIDAGHGGVDPGTIGQNGTQEKNITLQYALALKAKLLKGGHYRVKLTRESDNFIMLRGRVAIARKAGGSIFISLHADSAPDMAARGLSVYTLSEKASDEETEALAARENKADVLAGVDLSDEREDVAGILISLAERETKNRSATLADELVIALEDRVKLLVNTHRFAGFAVLKAPDIPSVLIEIGFLSHPAEEKLLKSKAYREKVTGGIAAGVDAYFKQQKAAEP